ncbi:MAG: hypothetical protein ACTH6Y_00930 [Vibrio hibernica]
MLEKIYDDMWSSSYQKIENNQYEIDTSIHDPEDSRRGITALAYLFNNNPEVTQSIGDFLSQIHHIEPNQYYYPQQELHLTILSIISCITGFRLNDVDPYLYIKIFNQCIKEVKPIDIKLVGVTTSSSCVLIKGFPVGEGLNELRDKLRMHFKQSLLRSSIDSRYTISTAHITAIRFSSQLEEAKRLVNKLSEYKDYDFGCITFTEFELVFNNWYQNLSETKSLSVCTLK